MKYDIDLMQKMTLFENVTKATVKDAFYFRERLTFIVQPGEMGKALGKNKAHLTKLEDMMKLRIKIAEFDSDVQKFIVNFLNPLKIQSMEEQDGVITLHGADHKTNGLIIGSRAQNLRALEEVIKKYFEITEIKVV